MRVIVTNFSAGDNRSGWHRSVVRIDPDKQGDSAFIGEWLSEGPCELDEGSLVLEIQPTHAGGRASLWRIESYSDSSAADRCVPDGPWRKIVSVDSWPSESLAVLDVARAELES